MVTNDNLFGNIDFSPLMPEGNCFHDANHQFIENNPVRNPVPPANPVVHANGNGQMATFSSAGLDEKPVSTDGITPILDINAINNGLEEAARRTSCAPIYNMAGQTMEKHAVKGSFNPAISALLEGHSIDNLPLLSYASAGNTDISILPDRPIVSGRKSFNPYADCLANLQQAAASGSNNTTDTNSQILQSANPNYTQNNNSLYTFPQIGSTPHMVSAATPTFSSDIYRQSFRKKSKKVAPYAIMRDFIARTPMFTHQNDVYIYDKINGYYKHTPKHRVKQLIMENYRDIISDSGSDTLTGKVYELLLQEPQIDRSTTPLSDPTKISFANCTLDLQTKTLALRSPHNVVTHALNCNLARFFNQSENCPVFDKFLHDISGGDLMLEQRIWEIMGYCLTPDTNAKVFFLFQGVPNSGKTQLCNLLSDFFQEEKLSALSVHSLKEQFAAGNLAGKSLCVSPDLPSSELDPKSASIIKQLTGNDKVSAAVKYKNNTQFRFEGKLILASNYPLLTKEPDDAFMQRAVVVPFLHAVPKEKQDGNLLERLKLEKPAIASKALDAYFRLRDNHYRFAGEYAINSSLLYPEDRLVDSEITPLVYNFLLNNFERDSTGMVAIESAYELFLQNTTNQFTEKMFSSVFQRLAEELFGATRTRSYHSGKYKNARSSIAGIRLKQMFDQNS